MAPTYLDSKRSGSSGSPKVQLHLERGADLLDEDVEMASCRRDGATAGPSRDDNRKDSESQCDMGRSPLYFRKASFSDDS